MNTHTQGNWTWTNGNNDDYIDIDCDGSRIASIFINPEFPEQKDEHKANAELIVKAVNERKALLDALEACVKCLQMDSDMEEDFAPEIKQAKKVLNNAKNI